MGNADASNALPPTFSHSFDSDEARLEAQEYSRYLLAKSYFDCREYDRCAAVFLPAETSRGLPTEKFSSSQTRTPTSSQKGKSKNGTAGSNNEEIFSSDSLPRVSQRSLFLALYAKYMSGEKRKEEDSEMILGPADGTSSINKQLVDLARSLEVWFADRAAKGLEGSNQGWLEYLYGIVLAKSKTDDDARKWLIKSVHLFPFNWGAWLELSDLLNSMEELQSALPHLPQNLMTLIFNLYASQELYQATGAIHHALTELESLFPGSQFLKTQRALLYYHSKDFEEAEAVFSNVISADPYRIDSLDHYSNILYVMSARPKLAFLAQVATAVDKFRPETCCVIGNYYSLKSEHEKAVVYFRRALTLDRNFLSAWTLMGHEYVEMKNTHAAIESYRRAVDVNRKDYRAWFGLGLTYEMLEMHLYSLFYFQRAASLRPYDPKMWTAVGKCYDKIDRPEQSIKAYKRALVAESYYENRSNANESFGSSSQGTARPEQGPSNSGILDPETLYQIAIMYEKLDDAEEAAQYMEMTLAQEEGTVSVSKFLRNDPDLTDEDDDDGDGESIVNDETGADGESGAGTGVTHTTSKARIWLAKWALTRGELARSMQLANELCVDGVEVEEAKALIRDARARTEASKMA